MASHQGAGGTTCHTPSRENRSQATGPVKEEEDCLEARRTQRNKSLQEATDAVSRELRETKSADKPHKVSFNGVSVMVDTLMSVFKSISKENCTNNALAKAVAEADVTTVQHLISQQSVSLDCALLASVEQDCVAVLSNLLPAVPHIDSNLADTKHGLLHAAASLGSLLCARLLLEAGARPDVWDSEGQATPLHVATAAGDKAREMVELLLNNGAAINAGIEKDGGSVLHSAVRGGNVEVVRLLLENKVKTVPKTFYETALHIAAEHNNVTIAKLLLDRNPGCVDALKSRSERCTALHLAADSGYLETCTTLLEAGADVSLANGQQMTAVHLAARNRADSVLRLLLARGAHVNTGLVNARDADGRTPLFVCTASKGRGATECMTTLLQFGAEVDLANSGGYTPLHMAAIDRKPARVNLLISRDADLSMKNNAGFSALYFINKKVPQCMRSFEERLDLGLKLESASSEMSAKVKMDFNKLSPNINSLHRQDIQIFMELMKSSYHSLLKHPLSQAFLYLKWNQIKYLYLFFSIFCHFVYSTVYTIYALIIFGTLCKPVVSSEHVSLTSYVPCKTQESQHLLNFAIAAWICLIFFTAFYLFRLRYFRYPDSYIDIFLIISFFLISFHEDPFQESHQVSLWQFHIAAIGCFLTWLQMMFYIGRLPKFGKYVQMFRTVAQSVTEVMVAWISLLLAFGSSFMIMYPHNKSFSNFGFTIVKLFVMMLGGIDFEEFYIPQSQKIVNNTITATNIEMTFLGTSHILMPMFLFLVSIILMNLLVGLAVSDLQALSKSAKLKSLKQQAQLIDHIENFLFSKPFRILPEKFQHLLRRQLEGLRGQNCKTIYIVKPFDINDKTLPTRIKMAVYDNCVR